MFNIEQQLIGHIQELAAFLNYLAEHKNDIFSIPEWPLEELLEKFKKICLAHARLCEGELELAEKILKEINW